MMNLMELSIFFLEIFNAVYGCSIDKVFEDFDKEPIASGAIAQVYRATYCKNEGENDICTKCLYANLSSSGTRFIAMFKFIAAHFGQA